SKIMFEKVILHALPFAGGNKYSYGGLKNFFPQSIVFNPLELPGRGLRIKEKLCVNIHDLVEDIFNQISPHLFTPYALYGHSMGATLAYLLVKKIIEEDYPQPLHLFVSGRGGPSSQAFTSRYLLPDSEFRNLLISLGGIPKEVADNKTLMEFIEPIIRADFQVLENYQYDYSLNMNIPLSVFIGREEEISLATAATWQNETNVPIQLHQFEGGHFFIFDHAKCLVEKMTHMLQPHLGDKMFK
ncbi:MAG: thioesterase, partial [Flavobacterium sp.]